MLSGRGMPRVSSGRFSCRCMCATEINLASRGERQGRNSFWRRAEIGIGLTIERVKGVTSLT